MEKTGPDRIRMENKKKNKFKEIFQKLNVLDTIQERSFQHMAKSEPTIVHGNGR